MKKLSLYIAAFAALSSLTSCEEVWENNPTLNVHEGIAAADIFSAPENAAQQIAITMDNSTETLQFGCVQPDYGYQAPATYSVEISPYADFVKPEGADVELEDYRVLKATYNTPETIAPAYSEIDDAMCRLLGLSEAKDVPTAYIPMYFRVRVVLKNNAGDVIEGTEYLSNVVKVDQLSAGYLTISTPYLPSGMFLRGDFNGWGAGSGEEFLTTTDPTVWELQSVSISAGMNFKVADLMWGDINLGGSATPFEVGKEYELVNKSNDNLKMNVDFKGSATLSLVNGKYYLLMEPSEPDVPGQRSDIFVRGDFNGWGNPAEDEFFTTDIKGVWETGVITIPAGNNFKIANTAWGPINLGSNGTPIVAGAPYKLGEAGNILIENEFTGRARLTRKGSNYILLLIPQ